MLEIVAQLIPLVAFANNFRSGQGSAQSKGYSKHLAVSGILATAFWALTGAARSLRGTSLAHVPTADIFNVLFSVAEPASRQSSRPSTGNHVCSLWEPVPTYRLIDLVHEVDGSEEQAAAIALVALAERYDRKILTRRGTAAAARVALAAFANYEST